MREGRCDCGLRYAVKQQSGSAVGYCALSIGCGTRDEARYVNGKRSRSGFRSGTAHFVEHTIFKGTLLKDTSTINGYLDRLGGELNAYTTKEEIVLHATVLKEDLRKAACLLFELVTRATFPEREIETERGVILDEINSYKDAPSEEVYDKFEELLFEGHPLSGPILGTTTSVKRITTEELKNFVGKFFVPERMVFTVVADIPEAKVEAMIHKLVGGLFPFPADDSMMRTVPGAFAVSREPFSLTVNKHNHQTNCIVGGFAPSLYGSVGVGGVAGGGRAAAVNAGGVDTAAGVAAVGAAGGEAAAVGAAGAGVVDAAAGAAAVGAAGGGAAAGVATAGVAGGGAAAGIAAAGVAAGGAAAGVATAGTAAGGAAAGVAAAGASGRGVAGGKAAAVDAAAGAGRGVAGGGAGNLFAPDGWRDRIATILLANILGGPASNSVLNSVLREKNGWVYGVECTYTQYADTGLIAICFGCDKDNLERCLDTIAHETARFQDKLMSETRLRAAKKQLLGQLAISGDNGETQCLSMGKSILSYGRVIPTLESRAQIEAITAGDIQRIAQTLFNPSRINTLIYI